MSFHYMLRDRIGLEEKREFLEEPSHNIHNAPQ